MRAAFFDLGTNQRTPHCLRALREAAARHRSAGDLVVLVLSRPWPPAEAAALGVQADLVLHPEPPAPTHRPAPNGAEPPVTVIEAITLLGLDPARCFGYVDHCEGLRTLRVVGNPRVIGVDPELAEHASSHGWPVLEDAQQPAGQSRSQGSQ
ncbi:hypothetical protein OG455_22780 [Kitasatospora sp. NBC_01287]|uniref:hypothetical protein n=1 Tax=Kitasatospora sp. NBC_01287 TaxID=2903573 RepID=UPI002254C7FA|nr:hypothetical protein [Kitasatospora sp. NBC_01287]MCX4748304.1 hypothetical protein [Kitasatospora sp. NBC_01287]